VLLLFTVLIPFATQALGAYGTTYAGAMLVSLLWPVVAFALYLAIAIYYIWPRGLDSDLADADV